MNFIRNYFIGDYLRSESDVLKKANIRLIFYVVVGCISLLSVVFVIYLINGFYFQLFKSVFIIGFFIGSLYYLRLQKSITVVSHALTIMSTANNLLNVFVIFQEFNVYVAMISVVTVIFSFHTLGNRWGLFYSSCLFIPVLFDEIIRKMGIRIIDRPPQQLAFEEGFITLILLFTIVIYLIYFYHQSYELAKESLQRNMEELKKSKEMAEEMNRLKTNFLSNMSHEIRTPINGILGISQVIELETEEKHILEYVKLQQQSGRRLLNTITSILNLSRIEAGGAQLQLTIIDINKILSESIKPLEELARAKQLSFHIELAEGNLNCLSDETMLYQVINNITGNAIKFTDKGEIHVTTEHEGDFIKITITDTGIGISEEFLSKIFNPFEQESSGRTRQYEGSGLGLSISKKYIELMGGEINISSTKGKGSTFQIVLPLYQDEK